MLPSEDILNCKDKCHYSISGGCDLHAIIILLRIHLQPDTIFRSLEDHYEI